MATHTHKVILTSNKIFLEPSTLRQLENSITYKLTNYDGTADSTLKLQIQSLKQHLHAAGVWAKNGDGKKLDELHEAMEELNFTSKELDQEGIGNYSKNLIARHHIAYDKCETLVKEILNNHDLPDTFFLTIEAAAELRNDRNHERAVMTQIITTAIKNDVNEEILTEIRRKA